MAHWISSKLKAAETLLQQIDQQAAESLRKNEKQTSDDSLVVETSTKAPESKPLVKDQLKMKATENVVSQNVNPREKRDVNLIGKSNNDINRNDEAGRSLNVSPMSNLSEGLTDSDWTELLSVPNKKGAAGRGSATQSSNRISVIRALKKNEKKVGNSVRGLNLSAVDGRSDKVMNNGVVKSSRKSNVVLERSTSVCSDEKASIGRDSTPITSSVQSPSSVGESIQRDCTLTSLIDNRSSANLGRTEGVGDILDGEKLHPLDESDNSSQMTSISLERELDKKAKINDVERLKMAISGSNRSSISSRTPNAKKVSSLPSDEESETDSSVSSDSESETEKEERRKKRQQILAERASAKAIEAIKERENLVARLEGEKQSLEKILEERAKQQVQEASELQTTMMETMEAVELEKQKHNNTRMEVLARLAKLESTNADLTRSLANAQKHLQIEVDRIAELRQQIQMKETTHEELRRKTSSTHQNGDKLKAPKGVEFELEMLETEYSFVADKVARMQEQVKTLETSIETTQREIENPSEVEIELKRRLTQLTDHLIQKQAQVESLSSEKAMLLLRIEAISRLLDEHGPSDFASTSSRDDVEGSWPVSNSNLRSILRGRMQSGQKHLGSLVQQLDSIFCMGAMFLRRNSAARISSLVYLACLHLWVIYILMSHSPVSDDSRSGAVFSLESINYTGGV